MERDSVEPNEQSKRLQGLGLSDQRRIRTNTGGHREDRNRAEPNGRLSNGRCDGDVVYEHARGQVSRPTDIFSIAGWVFPGVGQRERRIRVDPRFGGHQVRDLQQLQPDRSGRDVRRTAVFHSRPAREPHTRRDQ